MRKACKDDALTITKPFKIGKDQVIRIPDEFRLAEDTEVVIIREGTSLVITPIRNTDAVRIKQHCDSVGKTFNRLLDYSNPPHLVLRGEEGRALYIKLLTTPSKPYDAKKETSKAAEKLRRQGLNVDEGTGHE